MTANLHGVRHPQLVTADAALTWFAEPAGGGEVIGYLFAPDRAEWFRYQGRAAAGPDGPRDLGGAFEIFATDGRRQLRWTHQLSGDGTAISLSEHQELLPAGQPLPPNPPRTRLEHPAHRKLAGVVTDARDGWITLGSARYARCQVPLAAQPGEEVWADLAEYTVSDRHGNLSVVDTLLLGLHAEPPRAEVPA